MYFFFVYILPENVQDWNHGKLDFREGACVEFYFTVPIAAVSKDAIGMQRYEAFHIALASTIRAMRQISSTNF